MIEKTKFINIRVSPEWFERITQRAKNAQVKRSELVRAILAENIELPTECEPPKTVSEVVK